MNLGAVGGLPGLGAIVDVGTLAKAVLYSLIAGVGIAAVFGGGVTSAAGLLEAIRARRTAAVVAWGTLVVACAALTLGAIAVGIYAMTQH